MSFEDVDRGQPPVNPIWRDRYAAVQVTPAAPVQARAWNYSNGGREVWHSHEEAQLIYVTRGVLRVLTQGGIWTLPPYHAIWLPPMVGHELHAIGDVAVRSAYLSPGALPRDNAWASCQALRVDGLLDAVLYALADEAADPDGRRRALGVPLLLHELTRAQGAVSGALPLPSDRRLRTICEHLLAHAEDNRTMEQWSEHVGASTRTLARLFRDETGLGFSQWRQQLRLAEALARLALGAPVAAIARDLGYQSPSAFIAMFRKMLGDTPQRYLQNRGAVA